MRPSDGPSLPRHYRGRPSPPPTAAYTPGPGCLPPPLPGGEALARHYGTAPVAPHRAASNIYMHVRMYTYLHICIAWPTCPRAARSGPTRPFVTPGACPLAQGYPPSLPSAQVRRAARAAWATRTEAGLLYGVRAGARLKLAQA